MEKLAQVNNWNSEKNNQEMNLSPEKKPSNDHA
jgi:hypothetical protein